MRKVIPLSVVMGSVVISAPGVQGSIGNPNLNEYFHLGEYYIQTKQHDLAITNYTSMIAKHPSASEAQSGWLKIGESYCYLMQQDEIALEKAKAEKTATKREIEQLESKVESHKNQGIAAFRKAIAQFPEAKAQAIVGIAQIYAACGAEEMDEALQEFAKVVAHYPEEAGRAQILIGDSYAVAGDLKAAKGAYLTAYGEFPEVTSLAMLKNAGRNFASEEFGEAADNYSRLINAYGIDGAYSSQYHPLGTVMQEAIEKRGEAERALKNSEYEIDGYTTVAARYYGTNVGMTANLEMAEALWHYGRIEEATSIVKDISSDYPRSVWAVRALFQLAKLQGISQEAVDTYKRVIRSYPQSIFWVKAQMELAELYLKLADTQEDFDQKEGLRVEAGSACKAIVSRYPLCPEGEKAKDFIARNKL